MLKYFFSPDNAVWRVFILIGRIWYLNILWLVCSLPVVTIGASTTALIYSCMKLRDDDGYPTRNFFHSFKINFKQATIIWLIYALVAASVICGMIFWNHSDLPFATIAWAVCILVGILWFISFMYVFAIQSKFVNTIKDTIRYSVLMAFTNFKSTILIALILIGAVLGNIYSYFVVNFITLNIGIGIITYWCTFHLQEVFKKYIPVTEYPDSYLDQLEQEAESEKKAQKRNRSKTREEVKHESKGIARYAAIDATGGEADELPEELVGKSTENETAAGTEEPVSENKNETGAEEPVSENKDETGAEEPVSENKDGAGAEEPAENETSCHSERSEES